MRHMLCPVLTLVAVVTLGWPAAPAGAQPRAGAPAGSLPATSPPRDQGAAPRPDRTTATYGDWVLRCELPAAGGEQSCEVTQTVLDGRGQPLIQIVARRGSAADQVVVSIHVAANATVSEPLRLSADSGSAVVAPFRRCTPRGCFAETQSPHGELAALAGRGEGGKVEYRDGDGGAVSVPVSLRGLGASLVAFSAAPRG